MMKDRKEKKKSKTIWCGVILFIFSMVLGLYLLYDSKLSGAEFVTFVIAFAVIGFVIAFIDEVQEFSLGGNKVIFKKLREEAKKTAGTETFRFLLSMAKRFPGGLAEISPVDDRVKDFWILYNNIIEFKCEEELKGDILEVVKEILEGQIYSISNFSDSVGMKYRNIETTPSPKELEEVALYSESIDKRAKANNDSFDSIKMKIEEGLNEYRKLYKLKEKLDEE